jgi:hypothetical protein
LDAVVASGCLGSPQLALLNPLQNRVRLDETKLCRLAGRQVIRFRVGHLVASGIYGFHGIHKL